MHTHTALLTAHLGQQVEILTHAQPAQTLRCFVRKNLGPLVAGDHVIYDPIDQIVSGILPRKSLLERPDIHKGKKLIAANIDQIFLVIAPYPEPIELNIDRALALAETQNIPIHLIFNKTDLANTLPNFINRYIKLGYLLFTTSVISSSKDPKELNQLRKAFINKTSLLVGQSGVGKSSLVNYLFNLNLAKVGEISQANQKGKHTTTTARLYPLSLNISEEANTRENTQAAYLIDSPGIREFGLWHLPPKEILLGFREFQPYLSLCQFRNCEHLAHTPGCALQKAVTENKITPERLKNYFILKKEAEEKS